jgi:hypothetical protein
MTTKSGRRKLHSAINDLSPETVATIVRQSFPRVKGARVDELARWVISNAHRQVSPRKPQRG